MSGEVRSYGISGVELGEVMNSARLGASLISALPIGLGRATGQLAAEVVYRQRYLKGLIKARKYRGARVWAMHLRCGAKSKPVASISI